MFSLPFFDRLKTATPEFEDTAFYAGIAQLSVRRQGAEDAAKPLRADPFALAVAAGSLTGCAFVAAIIPAGRAAAISPLSAPRTE